VQPSALARDRLSLNGSFPAALANSSSSASWGPRLAEEARRLTASAHEVRAPHARDPHPHAHAPQGSHLQGASGGGRASGDGKERSGGGQRAEGTGGGQGSARRTPAREGDARGGEASVGQGFSLEEGLLPCEAFRGVQMGGVKPFLGLEPARVNLEAALR